MRIFVGRAVAVIVALLARTWRVRFSGALPPGAAVVRVWHEDLLALAGVAGARRLPLAVLVSRSVDGQWAASAARALGFEVVRGSSSRGALPALRALRRRLLGGAQVVIAADGPRGPRRGEAPGAATLARLGGASLVAVEVSARPAVRLPTWDRHLVPLPFARVSVTLS